VFNVNIGKVGDIFLALPSPRIRATWMFYLAGKCKKKTKDH